MVCETIILVKIVGKGRIMQSPHLLKYSLNFLDLFIDEILRVFCFVMNWNTISVVGVGRHFRGYLNDEFILHAYQSPLDSGETGLGFTEEGTFSLREISVVSIDQSHGQ